ncbi:MAG: AI-2E family transporter [Treponema sp.]|nr:AI-2E family transporter [Candidatus Treponema equifaecale]
MDTENKFVKGIFFLFMFFGIVLAGTLLKTMDTFFKPLILSILFAFTFYPLIRKIHKNSKLPWWLSIVLVYFVFFVLFFLVLNLLSSSLRSIIDAAPRYNERFETIQQTLLSTFGQNSESKFASLFNFDENASVIQNLRNQFNIIEALKTFALSFTSSIVGFMKSSFLVLLFSIFLLAEMKKSKQKVNDAFSDANRIRVKTILHNIITDVTHYISIKFIISLVTGLLSTLVCLIVGMDFPLIWGFLAFALNFIPTFGSIISSGMAIIFAIVQFYPSVFSVLFIAISFILINFVLGNVIEPRIEGENLGISPFVILVSLSLWGWLWGILGMILAVPFMVIVKIICENISYLNPIAILLGNKA